MPLKCIYYLTVTLCRSCRADTVLYVSSAVHWWHYSNTTGHPVQDRATALI